MIIKISGSVRTTRGASPWSLIKAAIITVNGGATWSSWLNQPTAQLYHVGISNTFPYRICSGQQESGSVCILSRGNEGASPIGSGIPSE